MSIQKWPLEEIIAFAKERSPYYRSLYQGIDSLELSVLPIIDQQEFWNSKMLTNERPDGIVFKSGGSTGAPKFSYFTSVEWESFTTAFGLGIAQGILDDDDRIGNVFYVGDMYASFLFIGDSLSWIPASEKRITRYPIGGSTDPKSIFKTILEFDINVLVGVPTSIMTLMDYYVKHQHEYSKVRIDKVLFGGESMYPDQQDSIRKLFPQVQIASVGYASVDAGLLGYADRTCKDGEHRVFDGANIIELVDSDTGEIIAEMGRAGRVIVTNLTRKLMPIIRYPAGDLAEWVEPEGTSNRKFRLIGRSGEAARLGTINVHFEDLRAAIMRSLPEVNGLQLQLVLEHFNQLDCLTIRVGGQNISERLVVEDRVMQVFIQEKPVYIAEKEAHHIHPVVVEVVELSSLEMNSRTGKIKRVIDRRSA